MVLAKLANDLCLNAVAQGRNTLLEHELYGLLQAGGVKTPRFFLIPKDGTDIREHLQTLPGDKVVVKVVSPQITHKTEAGGVKVCANTPNAILEVADTMFGVVRERVGAEVFSTVSGLLVTEFIPNDQTLGSQLFVGMRFTPDMGHVVAIGFGGLEAEEYAMRFKPGEATVMFSPTLSTPEEALQKFKKSYAYRKMTGKTREAKLRCSDACFLNIMGFFRELATEFSNVSDSPFVVRDFEVNPFFVGEGSITAVDAFMRFEQAHYDERVVDVSKIRRLLNPETVVIAGVSTKKINIGGIILGNLLRDQFPTDKIRLLHPEAETIEGVACVKRISELPFVADFLVLAVGADQLPEMIEEALESGKANALLIIAGGMGETEWGKQKEADIKAALAKARLEGRNAPIIVGPNCMGVRSRPGKYDTLFVPSFKLPLPEGNIATTALVSQSGAFLITRMNQVPMLDCPYCVSTGNQMDLTFTDFVEYMVQDDKTPTIGVYIEGFKPLDGQRMARLIKKGRALGKDFVVYKAGRTAEGASATSSHTASISGDYQTCVEILRDAGALIADTFGEFRSFVNMGAMLHNKEFRGTRLAGSSNAGFETVGMADNLMEPEFGLAKFTPITIEKLQRVLKMVQLEGLVTIRNPLDLNAMAIDLAHAAALEAVIQDENVDAFVLGLVPYSPVMKTLPPGSDPRGWDDFTASDALPAVLNGLTTKRTRKPIIAVVDAGPQYDPFAAQVERKGIPCFRSVDVAMKVFQKYILYKLGDRPAE